nr:hypothetical protein GCM10025732_09620 [Glycomyces mayteni]
MPQVIRHELTSKHIQPIDNDMEVPPMALSGEQWVIAYNDHEATIVAVGGGVRSYSYRGRPVVMSYGDEELAPGWSGHVLAPWPNRIRDGKYAFDGTDYQLPVNEIETNTSSTGSSPGPNGPPSRSPTPRSPSNAASRPASATRGRCNCAPAGPSAPGASAPPTPSPTPARRPPPSDWAPTPTSSPAPWSGSTRPPSTSRPRRS